MRVQIRHFCFESLGINLGTITNEKVSYIYIYIYIYEHETPGYLSPRGDMALGSLWGLLGARRGIFEDPGAVLSSPWGSLGALRRTLSYFGRPWKGAKHGFENIENQFVVYCFVPFGFLGAL